MSHRYMAYAVMAYTVMAFIVLAYIVMGCIVMAGLWVRTYGLGFCVRGLRAWGYGREVIGRLLH